MNITVEDREYWLRAVSFESRKSFWPEETLVVLVDMNPSVFYREGVCSQSELSGPGTKDVRLEPDFGDERPWTKEEAYNHCFSVMTGFVEKSVEMPKDYLKTIMLGHLQAGIEGITTGSLVVAPTGHITHEVLVPREALNNLIERSKIDLTSFCCLEQAGYQCLRTKLMDRQPTAFQNWFTKLVTGDAKRPEKQPKYWATLLRDRLISDLVSTLRKHGIDHSRNPTTDEDAGFDIVANACLDAGIKGVSSDQTVKGIYYKATA